MSSKLVLSRKRPADVAADAVVLYAFEGGSVPKLGRSKLDRDISRELIRRKAKFKLAEVTDVVAGDGSERRFVLVVGLGKTADASAEGIHKAAAAAVRRARALRCESLVSTLPGSMPAVTDVATRLRLTAEGLLLGSYRFEQYLTRGRDSSAAPPRITLALEKTSRAARAALERARALADAAGLARDLVNEPAASLTPSEMVSRTRRLARQHGLSVKVLGPREIERQKMRALATVGRGSHEPERVVHLVYKPKGRPKARLAWIGKGVTFDSGGYNMKTGSHMDGMKADMAGSAAVVAAMMALTRVGAAVEVHGVVGLVENLVSGRAFKPGDVLVTRSGKTVEVNNTDAEGRLVLADLLDYARTTIKPDATIDLATLTGACVIALGPAASGLMGNDERWVARIRDASQRAGERVWQLPLYDDYVEMLRSDVADRKNTGSRYAGALTAGLFLREFAGEGRWAHLDIAGPAFLEKDDPFWGKGGTGAGVATLLELALSY
ncbi:MAG: leucyl aminopeptidase [Acidobacteriota bacterium]|nr:MAG: leucyl aminopeptidase [Acidobacteriota bacterium]